MNIQIGSDQCSTPLIFGESMERINLGFNSIGIYFFVFDFSRFGHVQRRDVGSTQRCTGCGTRGAHRRLTFRWSSELLSLCFWLSNEVRRLSAGKRKGEMLLNWFCGAVLRRVDEILMILCLRQTRCQYWWKILCWHLFVIFIAKTLNLKFVEALKALSFEAFIVE